MDSSQSHSAKETQKTLPEVKNIIAVASGKGGVGKSTVSANLAIALAKTGASVGLIDADIYGPSMPTMFGLKEVKPQIKEENGKQIIMPIEQHGIKLLSIGFFVEPDQALLWRGPMASGALSQLFTDAEWGALDYMVIDLPPGTGDIHLTLVQSLAVTGVVIVSTPQEIALADARRAFGMFKSNAVKVPILGLIENMAYFTPEELPENKYYIFGKEGGKELAEKSHVALLGQIPLVQKICESGDQGKPLGMDDTHPVAKAFDEITENLLIQLNIRNSFMRPTQKVNIDPNAEGCSHV
ncbi:MAG: sodium:proton antiporter [Bacteroidetes bacterium]|nr:MAG: sodium:proton antiporter [Bacteroidota bacterium]PIE88502.1 MAG: sodium:proton antiporter [Bacteroidota bacterium]